MCLRFGKSIFLITVLLFVFGYATAFAAVDDLSHGKAALVNGAVITSADFHDELRRVERLRGANKKSPDPAESARNKKQALEKLITRELLYQEAGKRGIKVPEKVVNEEMDKLKKQFSKEAEFNTTLGKMGLSGPAVRAQIERGMAVQLFIDDEFTKKVRVSEDEIASYYERHRDDLKEPLASAREKIRQVLQREEASKKLTPYLKRLREKAVVEILLEEEE
jgi:peptidyl-prolyl cis-trans isomerase C